MDLVGNAFLSDTFKIIFPGIKTSDPYQPMDMIFISEK